MSDLKGTAVVTGATGGVGALYAAGLAERGYDLLLVGRQQKTLEALAKAVKQKANVRVETLVANLAQAKDLARVEARISSDPAITALINNAGVASFGPFAKLSPEAMDETVAVNVAALTRLTHAVLHGFLARGAGSIVNIASVLAFHPWPEFGVYNASKAYVVSFSQALQGASHRQRHPCTSGHPAGGRHGLLEQGRITGQQSPGWRGDDAATPGGRGVEGPGSARVVGVPLAGRTSPLG
jgi:short-subunit dehydrogenase